MNSAATLMAIQTAVQQRIGFQLLIRCISAEVKSGDSLLSCLSSCTVDRHPFHGLCSTFLSFFAFVCLMVVLLFAMDSTCSVV